MKRLFLLFCLAACTSSQTETIDIREYVTAAGANKPTIYLFLIDACEPCQEAKTVVEREAGLRGDRVVIVKADDARLMKSLGYSSLPVLRFAKPGAPDLVLRDWDKNRFIKAYAHFDDSVVKR